MGGGDLEPLMVRLDHFLAKQSRMGGLGGRAPGLAVVGEGARADRLQGPGERERLAGYAQLRSVPPVGTLWVALAVLPLPTGDCVNPSRGRRPTGR